MKIYQKGTFAWQEKQDVNLTTEELIQRYVDGYAGCYFDTEEYDIFTDLSKETGGYTNVEDAAHAFGWAESFAGQLVAPFIHVMEKFPGAWPGPAQGRGDCQNGSDLVRMADGSLKMIKDIKTGEYVISAAGNKRMVTNTFKKPYNKKMVEIKVEGYLNKIASTPDHRYIVDQDTFETRPIGELSIGDTVYLSPILYSEKRTFDLADYYDRDAITEDMDFEKLRLTPVSRGKIRGKNSNIQVNRFIDLDEKLSWLAGIYAAEGGIDGDKNNLNRITFNLGAHEIATAQQIKQYFNDIFGIDPYVYQVPSKPSVIYVRVCCSIIASFFKYLINGNTYTKKITKEFFITNKSNKIALLKGWFDGDGHKAKYGAVGVSVSKSLITDLADIANSVGIKLSVLKRRALKQSKESFCIRMKSNSAQIFMKPKTQYITESELSIKEGREVKIVEINIVEPEEPYVYCIEVEKDHNFICNGFGINNCVSHSDKNAKLGTMVGDVVAEVPDEVTGNLEAFPEISADGIKSGAFSTEAVYWYRNHGGDGWFCGAAANVSMRKCGGVIRKNYPELGFDLTRYSASLAGRWGRTEPPQNITEALNNNLIRTAARASTFEAARDALGQGRFLSTCGGEGFSNTRDNNGVSSRRGSWAHAMAEIGSDDREETKKLYNGPLVLVLNSWGVWNSGPRDIRDSAKFVPPHKKSLWESLDIVNPQTGNIMIPKGSFWCRWNDWRNRERLVYAGFNGWKRQKIENWGLELWG